MKTWQIFLVAFVGIILLGGCLAIAAGGSNGSEPSPNDDPWHLSQDGQIPQRLRARRHPSEEEPTEMFKELSKYRMTPV
ncbi:hypothetical protein NW752_004337 [Fusarium irregulare]|uniref:Uncharacterized protein n=1 Tax=Fusarium irregulare TaxID=2494466 RepID=A0A9W8PN06_9HYPO|nr:hypothetical protein NW766_007243 [Fusarium irregulare]KAJ4021330.1 hypothetical protein NW752_004337 [Fusarium irregulare]